jgi:hypothetical protein
VSGARAWSNRSRPSGSLSALVDLHDDRGLGVGVILDILPVLRREVALRALVALAVGVVRP